MIVFLNGKFLPADKAKISIFDNGFLYGDGIYETLRTYEGKVLEFDIHLKRFVKSAKALDLKIPYSLKKIETFTKKIIALNNLSDARVRITLSRGQNGFNFTTCKNGTLSIVGEKLSPVPSYIYKKGVSTVTYKLERIFPESKTLSLIHMIVANRYLAKKNAYEAILIDCKNFVREGAETNIFIVKNGILITPKNKILPGTARDFVMRMIKDLGLKLEEKDFKTDLLRKADEIFLTNKTLEIIPVRKLDGKKIGKGKIGAFTQKLMKAYPSYVKKNILK